MRKYSRSLDAKYSDANEIRKYLMPTWQKAASLRQLIGINNLIIKENKEMWRETGTTPDLGTRILKNLKMTGRNTVNRIFWTYNALGGLVDRTLGAGTMIWSGTFYKRKRLQNDQKGQ